MVTATDNLEQAEKIVKGIVYGPIAIERALMICRWLFSFNMKEQGFKVKCYQTKVPEVRFCVDRGNDCEGREKILTVFVTIRSNLQIIFHTENINFPYLQKNQNDIYFIIPEASKKLDMEIIKSHILEAYCQKINKLKLNSPICKESRVKETNKANDNIINNFTKRRF